MPSGAAQADSAKLSPARRVAFQILAAVGEGKKHSDELLHSALAAELSQEDKNLATALVMGVLRWQIALDAHVGRFLSRPEQTLPAPVAIALRMGVFQLRHMDRIPAHAALSQSVELCRAAGQPQAAGMVNAVLRRVATTPTSGIPLVESVERMARRLGHPAWIVERWAAQYGRAVAMEICEYGQREPNSDGLLFCEDGLPQIDSGSRLVAELAAVAAPRVEGRRLRVWDCCAAPGGKTLVLAARLKQAEILASDVSPYRLEAMRRRIAGANSSVAMEYAVIDASNPPPLGEFDLILVDAPCSGTGTLARNPEIRHRLRPEDLARQADRQRAILKAAASKLARGGRLVYSTCSLESEEGESVLDAVPDRFGIISAEELANDMVSSGVLPMSTLEQLKRAGCLGTRLRTLPGVVRCDGFFAAVLERR